MCVCVYMCVCVCVTYKFTVFFPALLTGSLEMAVISLLPCFNLYNNLLIKIIEVEAI